MSSSIDRDARPNFTTLLSANSDIGRMDTRIAVIVGPPGSGKTTLAHAVARRLGGVVVDQDTLMGPLVAVALTAAGLGPEELDSPYFVKNLSQAAFESAAQVAAEAASSGVPVLLVAPFDNRSRVGWRDQMEQALGVAPSRLLVVWLDASTDLLRVRLMARAAQRDSWKLANWPEYAAKVVLAAPDGAYMRVDAGTPLDVATDGVAQWTARQWNQ